MRSLYVSPYSSKVGGYVLPPQLTNIIDAPTKQDALIKYLIKYQFKSVCLYDLHKIFGAGKAQKLATFIGLMKAAGITEVNAIGSVAGDFSRYAGYNEQFPTGSGFDGFLTEVEFWQGDAHAQFQNFLSLLAYIKNLKAKNGTVPVKVMAYVGWLNRDPQMTVSSVANSLAALCDRVLVHCYVKDPAQAYGYGKQRIEALKHANPSLEVFPIFSAEGMAASAGGEKFMGDWMAKHKPDALDLAESLVNASANSQRQMDGFAIQGGGRMDGFAYYEYAFMKYYAP